MNNQMTVKEITFKKIAICAAKKVSPEFIHDPKMNHMASCIGKSLMLELKAYVLGIEHVRPLAKYPKGSWQFFKLDYMPKWFIRHFPVKYTEIIVELKEILNKRISIPNSEKFIMHVAEINHVDWIPGWEY